MVYVGLYALICLHTIRGIDYRDGLPRGALPSGILKMRKKCQGLKIDCSKKKISNLDFTQRVSRKTVLLIFFEIKILRVLVEKSQFSTSKNEFERHGIILTHLDGLFGHFWARLRRNDANFTWKAPWEVIGCFGIDLLGSNKKMVS